MVKFIYEAPQAQALTLLEEDVILQSSVAGSGTIEPGQDAGDVWTF